MTNEFNEVKQLNESNKVKQLNEFMLTTIDNPYNPFEQFTSWFMFDTEKGYYTCSKLARIAKLSDEHTEQENDAEIDRAIDEIIQYDFVNIYKRVTPADY